MAKPRYIAYDANGRVIANHLDSWVTLAMGVSASHPGEPFSISTRHRELVYSYEPLRATSVRVSVEQAEARTEGAA
jgi:hypothetical protein